MHAFLLIHSLGLWWRVLKKLAQMLLCKFCLGSTHALMLIQRDAFSTLWQKSYKYLMLCYCCYCLDMWTHAYASLAVWLVKRSACKTNAAKSMIDFLLRVLSIQKHVQMLTPCLSSLFHFDHVSDSRLCRSVHYLHLLLKLRHGKGKQLALKRPTHTA